VDEYRCITLLSRPGESAGEFTGRLSALWTHALRRHQADFEKVYAEMSIFENRGVRLSRQYLVEAEVAIRLGGLLRELEMDFEPIDEDEVYSKYEATPPEWFLIEH